MPEEIKITRKIFGKTTFQNVIDTTFDQLVPVQPVVTVSPPVDVKGFFQNYNDLFYDIPPSGSYSGSLGYSHLDLVNRSSEYIGISLSDMEDEITELRNENVALKAQIFAITQISGSVIQ